MLASWAETHGINSATFGSIHPEYGTCERCSGPIEDWLVTCPACGHKIEELAPQTATDAVTLSDIAPDDPIVDQLAYGVAGMFAEFDRSVDLGDLGGIAEEGIDDLAEHFREGFARQIKVDRGEGTLRVVEDADSDG